MKKLLGFLTILFFAGNLAAQTEELSPLGYNPALYNATRANRPTADNHRYLIDKGTIVVKGDTLNLPFVDDFSTNRVATLGWNQSHLTDTFYNVTGTCLAIEGVSLIEGYFMRTPSYSYTFDVDSQRIDSTANDSIMFNFFGPSTSGCFAQAPSPLKYWSSYYRYTFDVLGQRIDSALVQPDDTLFYAPVIYFAQAEPGKLWADNYAYINNTYPLNPPTIGVATLDGLNEYGLPYNNSSNHTYGTADYLTSRQLNLYGLAEADSVYLSFFYEPKGLGDYPDLLDSLLLEFKDNNNQWRTVWYDTGYTSALAVPDQFKRVLVKVPDLAFPYTYFYNTFQFRFRNKASLYGNNDHWHIDYVKLDKNRYAADTIIYDMAFVYPFPTVLKNFTLMPADQFDSPADLSDSILLTVHNMDPNAISNPPATNFINGAEELYPTQAVVMTDVLQTFNAAEYSSILVSPAANYVVPNSPNWPVDSLVINPRVLIIPNDSRPGNDTLYHRQQFDNTYAYDDGSAELSYGITGTGLKKFAYEFKLNHPDTLSAFQIQYSQVEENVSDLVFNFYAWDTIVKNNVTFNDADHQVFKLENKKPFYIDSINGFTTYKLDSPIIIPSHVYFGWAQTDTRRLQVGYDLNSKLGKPHMLIFTGTTWKASTIFPEGSPMIRLIFDSDYYGNTSTAVSEVEPENNISVYPNPTTGMLNISQAGGVLLDATVTNMLGETVLNEHAVVNKLDLNNLQNGVYLLALRNTQTGKAIYKKVIKTTF
jgi:hypothetical protein